MRKGTLGLYRGTGESMGVRVWRTVGGTTSYWTEITMHFLLSLFMKLTTFCPYALDQTIPHGTWLRNRSWSSEQRNSVEVPSGVSVDLNELLEERKTKNVDVDNLNTGSSCKEIPVSGPSGDEERGGMRVWGLSNQSRESVRIDWKLMKSENRKGSKKGLTVNGWFIVFPSFSCFSSFIFWFDHPNPNLVPLNHSFTLKVTYEQSRS